LQKDKGNGKKSKQNVDPFDLVLNSGDLFDWSHGKKSPMLDRDPHRTEERKDRPGKMSLNTACGLLRLYCLSMEPFLAQQGIWP
jgi:hypothetical protein